MPAASSGARAASRSAVAAPAGPEPTMMTARRSTKALLAPGHDGRHRPCAQLDSPDPARDNAPSVSPERIVRDRQPRGHAPRGVERRGEPRAARAVGGPLLPAGEAVRTRAGTDRRALLLRAGTGAGREHDRAAGESADGVQLLDRSRADRAPHGTGFRRAGGARAATLPALPPALHARPLSSSRAAHR